MKLNMTEVLKTPKGEIITSNEVAQTFESIAYECLLMSDSELDGAQKLKQAKLAKKILGEDEITLEEAVLIKSVVGKYCSPSVVLAIEEVLENQNGTSSAN